MASNYRNALLEELEDDPNNPVIEAPPMFAPGEPDPTLPDPTVPEVVSQPKDYGTADKPNMPYWVEGLDLGKYTNPEHQTGKYLLSRYQSQIDPSKGVSQELIDQLNADQAFKGANFRGEKNGRYFNTDPPGCSTA